jgi:acyl transferase domain-containing protein/NADPH:quinone reductase-like Zn-dependent oxidoreductase/acyl-coenzyme A synthetase/AMP-(fatty) acid ligase/acyl carrier protein
MSGQRSLSMLRAAVEATAERSPGRAALSDGRQSRSYGELAELLAGAAAGERSRRTLRIGRSLAEAERVLCESCAGHSLLLLDGKTTAWERDRAEALFAESAGDEVRHVLGLCTSGSSGLPKVVELDWESVLLNARSFASAAGYVESDVLWCTTPLAHLYCLGAGVLGGLLSGATVLLGEGMLEGEEFADLALGQRPTVLLSVPFLFRRYLGIHREAPELAAAWKVRSCIAAGEPVPADLVAAWGQATGSELRAHYGLTEGGQITLAGGGEDDGVGPPLEDVELRIGEDGQVSVRRRPPGRPYLVIGQDADPDGWYATGDLGRLDERGNLHITGRVDSRINVAGKKVDPVEVEEALLACEGVDDCAVAGVEAADGARVVAFLRVADPGLGDGAIRAELATRLSPHKLPRRFVRVAEIPRTLTGKVRRGELIAGLSREPSAEAEGGPRAEDGREASASSLGRRLAGALEQERDAVVLELVRRETASVALGHSSAAAIEAGQSFKDLGFDSAAAVELAGRLSEETGLVIPATALFDHPNPTMLTRFLRSLAEDRELEPGVAVGAVAAAGEPIAIVGMSCRYPLAGSPAELWRLLAAGGDGISPFPDDRGWDLERLYDPDPDNPGTSYVREGGFLADAAEFDAEFFGISPREALAMDPQQRLLLEAAWETLEDAGIDPERLRETEAAVFAGLMSRDYLGDPSLPETAEGYGTTGLAGSVVSGRVAYFLGLKGPAVTVDTACSSSLVAIHLAAQSLRLGECRLALAGGVTVMATPSQFVEFSRQRGLAPDARCRAFAAAAEGTAWGEGVGLLALERLSDARRNGRRVLALVRGSAINQDGASNGLTAPNGPSQEQVIRQALANAGLGPEEVDAVEAHGTGTPLGDPIEAQALIATYGEEREQPLRLGSIKSNLGHTLAAAGVAGVIKMVLAMREGVLPKTLHVEEPSPHVDWSAGTVKLLTEAEEWEAGGRPRRAGVSSFGISGTNAHLILEEPPAPEKEPTSPQPEAPPAAQLQWLPWLVSARSGEALGEQAGRLVSHLGERPEFDPLDVAFSLATSRSQLGERAVLLGSDREELLAAGRALAAGEPAAGLVRGSAREARTAFLFTGQGAQRPGMGRELHAAFPAFAAALDAACDAFDPHLQRPLAELLFAAPGSAEAELLDRTRFTQPALFAIEVALYRLLESLGLAPDFLIGHSIGELAAAHVAGVFSLPDACKLVAARGALMDELASGGAMVAIAASEEEVRESLDGLAESLSIAAVNGPASVVVSGEREAALELAARWRQSERKTSQLRVSHAFHSHRMEPMLEDFVRVAESIEFSEPRLPIVSNLTGEPLGAEQASDPLYWARQVREPVRFLDGVRFLAAQGVEHYLELGPHGVLSAMVEDCLAGEDRRGAVAALLRKDRPEEETFLASLAQAHVHGVTVDWGALFAGSGARGVELPTYAFQRRRYWLQSKGGAGDVSSAGLGSPDHPLLGATISLAGEPGQRLFTGRLSLQSHPWLADHAVFDTAILPGTAFVEMALQAGAELGAETIEELVQVAPLTIPEEGAVQIQLQAGEADGEGRRTLIVHSRLEADPEGEWARNASGALAPAPAEVPAAETSPPPDAEPIEVEFLYDRLAEHGFHYGPAFQGLKSAWRRGEELFAEIELDEEQGAAARRFGIHPALLDAALHPDFLAESAAGARLPFTWSGVRLHLSGASSLSVRLAPFGEDGLTLTATDPSGAPVVSIEKLATRPVEAEQLRSAGHSHGDSLFELEWSELATPSPNGSPQRLAILGDLQVPGLAAERHADLRALAEAIGEGPAPEAVLAAVGSSVDEAGATEAEGPVEAAHAATARTLALLQAFLEDPRLASSRLVVVSEGAVSTSAPESVTDLAAAAALGLLRSAHSEHPDRFGAIDADGSEASRQALPAALALEGEPQLALREGRVLAPRLSRERSAAAQGTHWRLGIERKGALESLGIVSCPEVGQPLAAGQVRIAVHAAGLNFRDVMLALGLVPGNDPIGGEGAGVVLETGAGVSDLAPGDRVLGLIPSAFGPVAVADRHGLAPIPANWSFAEAASVPVVCLTAFYGLSDLAHLQAGERVLIHAATGGVGTAAVALATQIGAEVFATAHPDKWEALRALGLEEDHIASSRDLDFRHRFLEATDGAGMDMVLNSLAGEFVDASLALLPRGGRFLEMGKTDIRAPEEVAAAHPGVSYQAFDLVEAGPDRTQAMLTEILDLFGRGALAHPPIATWDVRRGADAFRFMSQGRHVGKIVLTVPQPPDPDSTILITGGTGALGALFARHLAQEHGARHLLLASRRGPDAEGAAELATELAELGCEARIEACDAADREQLAALVDSIAAERPLGMVIHAAGVLDDGTIEALTPERLQKVMRPKVDAAWNLHELTREMEGCELVLFSSVAATLGSSGQANYAAANAFLDALAAQRRAEGLSALSLGWGAWQQESGMTAALSNVDKARIARAGIAPLSDAEGLLLFDAALRIGESLLPARLDRAGLRAAAAAGTLPAIMRGLVRGPARAEREPSGSLAARLAGLADPERAALVLELVRAQAAAVLGHSSPQAVPPERTFKDSGFDSLSAVELRNRLGQATGVRLPSTVVFDYPSPMALAEFVRERSEGGERTARSPIRLADASGEPIAIVGMSCRYPRAGSPAELWRLLAAGGDGISPFPDDRGWDLERLYDPDPDNHGTSYVREGGFLADAAEFDAEFFGISPREALAMDPQQRLLLEAAWETLEDAGIDPLSLRDRPAGVFAGISTADYGADPRLTEGLEGHIGTGTLGSVVSGRLAYTFGLQGPAVTVDTACSSGLVAMHLAAQALRLGECEIALAGGVTVLSTLANFIDMSQQRALAPDGRCKSFAASADGTGFSDGVGLLALERLSDARRNGRRVLALVRGSAINQDGASNGLTAPNGPSQEQVIRQALANAGLGPEEVDAVEAHGTGTPLGDPIEAQALIATYGEEREQPLRLGSIKSNLGHTLAAAGVAGVIKMVLAMREGVLPKTLHVEEPSPHVDWSAGTVKLLTEAEEWEAGGRPRRAGVSSFGISGTNAHLILEEPPAPEKEPTSPQPEAPPAAQLQWLPWLVSARSGEALGEQAGRLVSHLGERPEFDPLDVAFSLATSRSQLGERAVLLGSDREELLAAGRALAAGEPAAGLVRGSAREARTAFLFTGQGAQRPGMGRELHAAFPAFAAALDAACDAFDPHLQRPLAELLFAAPGSAEAELLDRTRFTQPALFAIEVALYRLLESLGLAPDFLIGHSIGELAAAHVAGVFSLPDACKLVAARGALMDELASGGAMVAIAASEEEVRESLDGLAESLSIAAVNGPASVVVSGEREAALELAARWRQSERKTSQLRVSHAFHSHRMEPMLEDFVRVAESIEFSEPRLPIVSNLTGEPLGAEQASDPLYWARQVREPVRFLDGVRFLAAQGVEHYLELGPHGVLSAMVEDCLAGEDRRGAVAALLRKDRPEEETFLASLAQAHVHGVTVDWGALFAGSGARGVELPTYAFQRRRYWLQSKGGAGDVSSAGLGSPDHPLLGATISLAGEPGQRLFTGRLSLQSHPWLADHAVFDTAILPGTAFVEMALQAGAELGAETIEELVQVAPLTIPEEGAVQIQLQAGEADGEGRRTLIVHSRLEADPEGEWARNASGALAPAPAEVPAAETSPPPDAEPIEVEFLYDRLAEHGFHYGPAFQGLKSAWRRGEELFAEIELDEEQGAAARRFGIHPALLDAALHPDFLAESAAGARLPFTWSGVRLHLSGASSLSVRLAPFGEDGLTLTATDPSGAPVVSIEKLATRPVEAEQLRSAGHSHGDSLFELEWSELATPSPNGSPQRLAILGDLQVPGLAAERHADLRALAEAIGEGPAPEAVLAAVGSSVDEAGATEAEGPVEAAHAATARTLALLQAFLEDPRLASSRLVVVSEGAVSTSAPESVTDLAAAAALGLLRSAHSEHPDRFGAIDADGSEASRQALPAALALEGEPQLALREGRVLAPRLSRERSAAAQGTHWRLGIERKGALESLGIVSCPEVGQPLAAGQVRIAVHAAGLNFRDVMLALGLVPGNDPIGGEGAGVVLETGAGVSDLAPGDRVLGLIPSAFGPVAVADRHGLAPIPANWSFAEAASVPVVCLTAFYGLSDLAHLQAGERVLIHAATGGVGTAAVALATQIGAEVFATAHPDKWEALRALGLEEDHIASSRDLDFRHRFLEATDGAGMDMVLNSLAGEFVDASLALLPRGGRFLEMGKTDIRAPEEVAAAHPGVSYQAFDLVEAGPDRTQAMLTEILDLFGRGALAHPPIATWDVRRGADAFRFMSQGRHVGKIVLTVPQPPDPDSTILITGGTGALGALFARHLAQEHGARHLLLASRRGPDAEGAAELATELAELGCEARIEACDAADREQLAALVDSIAAERPLGMVIHAAGVLDDGTIEALTPERLQKVMRPKVDAAWNLHELTREMEGCELVLFSSVAATLGSSGQANYAAANAFLDALAAQRRAEGLSALSLGWGAWQQESGMTAALSNVDKARIARAGIAPLSDAEGLLLFDAALRIGESLLPARLDRAGLRAAAAAGTLPAIMRGLVRGPARAEREPSGSLAARLAGLADPERAALVLELVRAQAAAVLGHSSPQAVPPERTFKDSGFDSLSAVELRNRLGQATGVRLPSTVVFDYPSPMALAEFVRSRVGEGGEAPSPIGPELDRFEALLRTAPDEEKARVVARLQSLLVKASAERSPGPQRERQDLGSVSDDEIIELIDEEFGAL